MFNQPIFERGAYDHNAVRPFIKEARDSSQGLMEQRVFFTDPDRGKRFGPEVAHFEDERDLPGKREPPTGESDEQLRGGGDNDVRFRERESAECGGDAEGCVIAHAFVGLAVGQRPKPGAEHICGAQLFVIDQTAQPRTPFCRNHSGGMIWKTREHGYLMSAMRPVVCEFGGAGRGSTHLRRKVLRDVEDSHGQLRVSQICELRFRDRMGRKWFGG